MVVRLSDGSKHYTGVRVAMRRQVAGTEGFDARACWPYNDAVCLRARARGRDEHLLWGRYGFDGGKDSRDACRAPL